MRSTMRMGNKAFQRSANLALVLRTLRDRPGLTRTELAETVGIDKSTISNIIGDAIALGLVYEHSRGDSTPRGGRRPISLRLNDSGICAIGFEIEPDRYRAIVLDNGGAVVRAENGRLRTEGLEDQLRDISSRIWREMYDCGVPVLGIAYGIPGSIDPSTGRVFRSRALAMEDFELRPSVSVSLADGTHLAIPTAVDNDANCCAWGELHARRGTTGTSNLLFVLLRRNPQHLGLGLGLVINGELQYRGSATHGEFYTHGWRGERGSQFSMPLEQLLATEHDGELRRRFLDELIENLTPVISLVTPQVIVTGGELRERFEEFIERIETAYGEAYMGRFEHAFKFRTSLLGDDEVAAGAAGMFLERLFGIPRFETLGEPFAVNWDRVSPILEIMHSTGPADEPLKPRTA